MSKETLVSKLGSCNSLTAGTNACAQIAGLRLDGMDVGALRKTLQDAQLALAAAKAAQGPANVKVKTELVSPVKSPPVESLPPGETQPAETQDVKQMALQKLQPPPVPPAPLPSPAEQAEGGKPQEPDDKELLKMAIQRIQELEKQVGNTESRNTESQQVDTGNKANPKGDTVDDDTIVTPDGYAVLGHDALRMRLRRLCEVKPSGKSHVDDDIRKEYQMGGDKREILEIALVEALKKWGTSKSKSIFNKVKAEFVTKVKIVRERLSSREQETTGKWYTEEKLKSCGEYAPNSIKAIIAFCRQFPSTLVRSWKYNHEVEEYFVEDETTVTIKKADITRQKETTELGDKVSEHAPKGPELMDGDGDSKPNAEVLGQKVVPELEKFMEAMNSKIAVIYDMVATLQDKRNPPPLQRYQLIVDDLTRIEKKLSGSFGILAGYLTEIKLDDLDKVKDDHPKLVELKEKIQSEKLAVKTPMAEFLSVECNYKRVKKDITKAWRKADEGDSENPEEPEKKRTKPRKTKRPEAEAEEAPEPAEPKAAAKSKSKAKKRSRPSK